MSSTTDATRCATSSWPTRYYWAEEFHIDGLRVDAVASMLYLDYSRQPGAWVPNIYGGKENLEAIACSARSTTSLHARNSGVLTIAEESTTWPGVTPVDCERRARLRLQMEHGLDARHPRLPAQGPVYRRYAHHQMTFGLMYAWSERFILPLSHDEVVHLKGSLLGKMSGDPWQRFANLRALFGWMWAHPGKKLLFMGGELADEREWAHEAELDWTAARGPGARRSARLIGRPRRALPVSAGALGARREPRAGSSGSTPGNADQNVLSFIRRDAHGHPGIACIANFAPVVRYDFRVGLPLPGHWTEVLNTDSDHYGGSGIGNLGAVEAEAAAHARVLELGRLTLPPLARALARSSAAPSPIA